MPFISEGGQPLSLDAIFDLSIFEKQQYTKTIYETSIDDLRDKDVSGTINIDGQNKPITMKIYQWSLFRLLKLQVTLSKHFIGYDEQIKYLLASAIAQEPILLIGKPGVAKTEMAVSFFEGIGLRKPVTNPNVIVNEDKYFEYLLSPFTIPEELFGPLNFTELQKGTVTRINANMATGKNVRGIFLDEIFNASSSILNTLLTLINERRYFDKGMFKDADLKIFIGASNITPLGDNSISSGATGKKSRELAAFYDRFTIRLYCPTPQEMYYTQVNDIIKAYEAIDKISQKRFMEKLTQERPDSFKQISCINDILMIGRILGAINISPEINNLKNRIVGNLAIDKGTQNICHISPRKPNKLFPIICSDSLLLDIEKLRNDFFQEHNHDEGFGETLNNEFLIHFIQTNLSNLKVKRENLKVFNHIWDFEGNREQLKEEVKVLLDE